MSFDSLVKKHLATSDVRQLPATPSCVPVITKCSLLRLLQQDRLKQKLIGERVVACKRRDAFPQACHAFELRRSGTATVSPELVVAFLHRRFQALISRHPIRSAGGSSVHCGRVTRVANACQIEAFEFRHIMRNRKLLAYPYSCVAAQLAAE